MNILSPVSLPFQLNPRNAIPPSTCTSSSFLSIATGLPLLSRISSGILYALLTFFQSVNLDRDESEKGSGVPCMLEARWVAMEEGVKWWAGVESLMIRRDVVLGEMPNVRKEDAIW
jgi:hypothetical protein